MGGEMMSQRGKLLVLVMLAATVVWLVGCPKQAVESPDMPPTIEEPPLPEATGEPIKIGAIFSVTGPAAPLGVPEKETVDLLVEKINSKGGVNGRPIEVIVKDDKSEPTEAALAAKDLVETENVVAIIGPSRSPCTMAILDYCQEQEVTLVACAASGAITNPVADRKWVFAVPQTDILAVAKIVEYLKAKDIKKVATIYVSNKYGESGQEQLVEQLGEAGIELLASETFGGEDTDMTAQVTKLKGIKPEAVICWGTNPGPATVAKNMKTLGLDVPLLQSHGVANQDFIKLAGEAANGVMLPAGRLIVVDEVGDDDPQKQVLAEYAEDYTNAYSKPADTFGGHAYDALMIVVKALESTGTTDRAALRDAIEATTDFVGTAGIFNYGPDDHNGLVMDAFVWVKIVDGDWQLAEEEISGS
jgi:branched-chain amino acid transport system substrate-binding protein